MPRPNCHRSGHNAARDRNVHHRLGTAFTTADARTAMTAECRHVATRDADGAAARAAPRVSRPSADARSSRCSTVRADRSADDRDRSTILPVAPADAGACCLTDCRKTAASRHGIENHRGTSGNLNPRSVIVGFSIFFSVSEYIGCQPVINALLPASVT